MPRCVIIRWDRKAEDVLFAVRRLLGYFGIQVWPPANPAHPQPIVTNFAEERARVLLHLIRRRDAATGQVTWKLDPNWRQRLQLAGVDPRSVRVVDEARWKWAWVQLRHKSFKAAVQQQRIAFGDPPPEIEADLLTKVVQHRDAEPDSPYRSDEPLKGPRQKAIRPQSPEPEPEGPPTMGSILSRGIARQIRRKA